MDTFAIVPGLWHDSRAWSDCARALRQRGHVVDLVPITGHGRHPDWMSSHQHCVEAIVAYIKGNRPRNLTLVGHSASATLVAEAAIKVGPGFINRIVLSSPLLPPFPGLCVLDTLPTALRELLVDNSLKGLHGNKFTPLLPFHLFREFFANGVSQEYAEWVFAHYLCPQPSLRLVAGVDLRRLAQTDVKVSILEVPDDPLCGENNQVVPARDALLAIGLEPSRLRVLRMDGGGLVFMSRALNYATSLEACASLDGLEEQVIPKAAAPAGAVHFR